MKQYIHRHFTHFVCLTLACWLLISAVSVHVHLCLDGQQAPLSFVADVINGIPDHHDDPAHTDVDVSLIKLVIVKLFKLDLPVVLAVLALLILSSLPQHHVSHRDFSSSFHHTYLLRPPLRAPPAFSA